MHPILMSVNDACVALGLGRTKLHELLNEGRLTKRKIGRRTLITTESVQALANLGTPSDADPVVPKPHVISGNWYSDSSHQSANAVASSVSNTINQILCTEKSDEA